MTDVMEDYLLKMFEEAMNETNQDLFNETATNSSDYATYEDTLAAYFEQMLNEALYANSTFNESSADNITNAMEGLLD